MNLFISLPDIMELQRVAFIPAANGTRLVTASSLFARLAINLSPFAFELPPQYLSFVKILKDLGLQDTFSVESGKDLLLNLQKACGYQRLNPNELRAVLEILDYVSNKSTEANTSDTPTWGSEAIVPDDDSRLVHAMSCIYVDSYGSKCVKYIDSSRLRFVHRDLPERICVALGIKKLSDVVVEELHHEEHLQCLDSIGSIPLAVIRQKLLSKSFQAAVWSIVNTVASDIPAFDNLALENIRRSLESVAEKLQFVKCLQTRFLLLPKSVDITRVAKESILPEWEGGSKNRALYFIDRLKTCMLIAEPPSYISVLDVVALVVSQALGSPIPLPIGSLILCPEESETALLNVLKLCSDERLSGCRGGRNSFLGSEILPRDAVHVQFHPLRPFYRGEIVAWRSQNGEKLKYGRVLDDVRPSAGQALYRFNVETSPGVTGPLLSSHVFSFRSLSTRNEDDRIVADTRIKVEQPEGSEITKSVSSQQQQPVRELQHGRVSAAELVQAVHEMLFAAGINMDVEKQSLLQTTLTMQEQLQESQAALLLEQEKFDMAAKEAETAKAAWLCRICLNSEVDITIIPCGH
ncbi:hypothetical protein RJ640_019393, partial [Escallonia rubra]